MSTIRTVIPFVGTAASWSGPSCRLVIDHALLQNRKITPNLLVQSFTAMPPGNIRSLAQVGDLPLEIGRVVSGPVQGYKSVYLVELTPRQIDLFHKPRSHELTEEQYLEILGQLQEAEPDDGVESQFYGELEMPLMPAGYTEEEWQALLDCSDQEIPASQKELDELYWQGVDRGLAAPSGSQQRFFDLLKRLEASCAKHVYLNKDKGINTFELARQMLELVKDSPADFGGPKVSRDIGRILSAYLWLESPERAAKDLVLKLTLRLHGESPAFNWEGYNTIINQFIDSGSRHYQTEYLAGLRSLRAENHLELIRQIASKRERLWKKHQKEKVGLDKATVRSDFIAGLRNANDRRSQVVNDLSHIYNALRSQAIQELLWRLAVILADEGLYLTSKR